MTNDHTDPSEPVEFTSAFWNQRLHDIAQERSQLQQERLDRKLAEHTEKLTQVFALVQTFFWVQTLLLGAAFGLVLSLVVTNRPPAYLPAQPTPQSIPTQPEQ